MASIAIIFSYKTGLKAKRRLEKIKKYLALKNVSYDLVRPDRNETVETLSSRLCEQMYNTVVVIGGDGSINDAINGIMNAKSRHKDFSFGIIPSGTANDFSKFWGVQSKDYKLAIDSIVKRKVRKIDLGVCSYISDNKTNRRFFLNCVNIGLGAKMVELAKSTKVITGSKRLSNFIAMIGQIFERKSFKLVFHTDSETLYEKVMSVCVGNTTGYGQTPNAVPYNGMLDMSVITRPEWWQIFEGFWLLEKGKFLNYKNVNPYRIWNVRFDEIGKAKVSLDGRIIHEKIGMPLSVSVLKETIPLIIP